MDIDGGKVIASACAIALHVALLAWWWRLVPTAPLPPDLENLTTAIWVPRAQARPVVVVDTGSHSLGHPRQQVAAQLPRSGQTADSPVRVPIRELPDTVDDSWTGLGKEEGRPEAFSERLRPLEVDSLEAQPKVSFRMRDSSLLGRIKELSQKSVCSELRAALRYAAGSEADVIVSTMHQRGCSG